MMTKSNSRMPLWSWWFSQNSLIHCLASWRAAGLRNTLLFKLSALLCIEAVGQQAQAEETQATNTRDTAALKVTIESSWSAHTNVLYNKQGAKVNAKTDSKHAVYSYRDRGNRLIELPVVAFRSPETGIIFIGNDGFNYLETDSGIVGWRLWPGGSVAWCKNLAMNAKPEVQLDSAIGQFEREMDPLILEGLNREGTGLISVLGEDFFAASPKSSRIASIGHDAKVTDFEVKEGRLHLDITSPTGVYKARVWIDIKSHRVLKADQDGKNVFPPL